MNQTKFLHRDLIKKCKKNNCKAQMKVYDLYCDAMFKTAFNFMKDKALAEDMMQESFIKAFQKLNQFNESVAFGAWLKKIVINQCLDYLKRRKLTIVEINENHLQLSDEDNWKVQSSISIDQVYYAIEQLAENYKITLKLFLLEGYDHQEIAQILNITEVASRSQLFRAKNKLKEMLKQKNYA
ncbi:sigma-70 family RNA polymerase sigma factor [Aureibaculum algae]|uniref:Sigma-70 family RNA polymerase sigma factor n=2 Tax=Aureibaculum TaxID=2706948 RepID=A0A5B7TN46_9FLAO|nr:sigma-70 family RNA polymerase sigma factor [Aureibaculum algae]QCX38299.1 sigma-70 family RNA polymerase sigma factor [Aureibaculum algae]